MANTEPSTTIPTWTLGDRLSKALDHSGVSVAEMADHLGVSRNTVGNYTSGRTSPRRAVMAMWALRTGVPFEWLMTGDVPTDPPTPTGGLISTGSSSACTRSDQSNVVTLATARAA